MLLTLLFLFRLYSWEREIHHDDMGKCDQLVTALVVVRCET